MIYIYDIHRKSLRFNWSGFIIKIKWTVQVHESVHVVNKLDYGFPVKLIMYQIPLVIKCYIVFLTMFHSVGK